MRTDILPFCDSFGYQIRMTHRAIQRRLQAIIEPYGVTLGMWYFLRVLWVRDGLTQRELSNLVGTMAPTTLSAIRTMEQSELIFRKKNDDDARKINIFLTEKGRSLEKTLLPRARALLNEASTGLTPKETKELLRMVKVIQENLNEGLGPAPEVDTDTAK